MAIWAYFDETVVHEPNSSNQRLPTDLLVGGCSATESQWIKLTKQWRKALACEHVTAFHAKHFYSFQKEFKWLTPEGKPDWERHGKFRDQLADIITANVDEAVVFTSQISLKNNGRVRQAYTDAALRAMHDFTWKKFGRGGAYVIFARHPEISRWSILRKFEQLNWDSALLGCGVFEAQEVAPLQVADFVCHATNKSWGGIQTKSEQRLIKGFRRRQKQYRIQLGSSWSPPAEILEG